MKTPGNRAKKIPLFRKNIKKTPKNGMFSTPKMGSFFRKNQKRSKKTGKKGGKMPFYS